ncbi:uncharacterized protein LOC128664566 [Bombina bombina]|uniref:uncharacterized protein LOC128664566 n=1 Tax=Bombina bombina TaxID=8345 RepID=UPI00235B0F92|nr:uncharacterized protein LOC128664566 [Bombina bombina]
MAPASPKRRQHWQRSVSAGYPQYTLAHAFLYCCIALWFNAPAAAAIKYKEPFSADELITPLDDITREPVGFPKQDNFVLLLKKTKDPPSLNDDLLPNLNPDVDIILTNSLAHLSEDIVYTIKQTAITDFSYLVIDTSTQIMKSGCIFLLSQDVRIKDTLSKWFMTLKGKVCASSLQGSININYKDKYTLSLYSRNYNIICTFKNVANNLYLAYEGGVLTLKIQGFYIHLYENTFLFNKYCLLSGK